MSNLLLLGALLAVAGIALVLLDTLIRRPTITATFVIATSLFLAAFGEAGRIPVGGLPVSVPDGIFVLVTLAGVARVTRLRRLAHVHWLLLLIWVLVVVSLVQGATQYGDAAIREIRPFLRFFGPALYFSTIEPTAEMLERLGRIWLRGVAVLIGLVFLRLAAVVGGVNLGPIAATHPSASYALRVLPGYESFTIGQAFVLTIPAAVLRPDDRVLRALAVLLGVVMVVLNRRTVYVAVIVGLMIMVGRSRTLRRGIAPLLLGIAAVAATLFGTLPDSTVADEPVAQSAVDTGTLVGRIEGWEYLLAEGPEDEQWLIGTPLGPGFDRVQRGREFGSNPHSYYVLLLLRTGFVGVVAFVSLYVLAGRRLWRLRSRGELLSPPTLLVLLAMQMIFFITWIAPVEQGVLLGLACAFCRTDGVRERATMSRLGGSRAEPDHAAEPAGAVRAVPSPTT